MPPDERNLHDFIQAHNDIYHHNRPVEYETAQQGERNRKTPGGKEHTDRIVFAVAAGRKHTDGKNRVIGKGEHICPMEDQHLNQEDFRLRLKDIKDIIKSIKNLSQSSDAQEDVMTKYNVSF